MTKYLLLLTISLCYSLQVFAKEELLVIQSASSDKRSFVIQKGLKDGIAKGQEVIFAGDNVSVVCKAIEVNRDFSYWRPVDKEINVPFKRDQIVSMNTHTFGNIAVDFGEGVKRLTPEVDVNVIYGKLRSENNITIRYSYGFALSQSSSSVSTTQNSRRIGEDFLFEYGNRLSPQFELAFGVRLDYDIYRLENPELDIPTERQMLTASLIYHAIDFSNSKNNFYAGVTVGIGNSKTTVSNSSSSGTATLLPQVRLGFLLPLSTSMAMISELSAESVGAQEKFSDGSKQETTQINTKFSVGLRF